jgi:hypothetical protein
MSEQNVTNLLGQASQSALSTCGQGLGKPWSCKTWTYGDVFGGNGLTVTFQQDNSKGAWVVNGWR